MADFPYLIRLQAVLSAGGRATLSFQASNDESYKIFGWRQKSTGNFDVEVIRDSRGVQYSNAAAGSPLDGEFIQDVQNAFISIADFPQPIDIPAASQILIDVIDTSAAPNTVEITLISTRHIP